MGILALISNESKPLPFHRDSNYLLRKDLRVISNSILGPLDSEGKINNLKRSHVMLFLSFKGYKTVLSSGHLTPFKDLPTSSHPLQFLLGNIEVLPG